MPHRPVPTRATARPAAAPTSLDLAARRRPPLADHARRLDVVELRPPAFEVPVARCLDGVLRRSGVSRRWAAARRRFSVARIERVDDVHSAHHLGDRRKTEAVQRIEPCVVLEIDVELDGARSRSAARVRDGATRVAVLHRIVGEPADAPSAIERRVAGDSELGHEILHDAEEARAVVVVFAYERVESVYTGW